MANNINFNYQVKSWNNGSIIATSDLNNIEHGIEVLYQVLGKNENQKYQDYVDAITDTTNNVDETSVFTYLAELNGKISTLETTTSGIGSTIRNEVSTYISSLETRLNETIASVNTAKEDAQNAANQASAQARQAASEAQAAAQGAVFNVKQQIGTNYYDATTGTLIQNAHTISEDLDTINSNITEIIDAIGNDYYSNGVWQDDVNSISVRLSAIESVIGTSDNNQGTITTRLSNLEAGTQAALGSDYYTNGAWTTNLSTSVTARLDNIEETLGDSSSGGGSLISRVGGLETNVDTIQDYLGLGDQSGSNTSLIDQIESALGRNLEYDSDDAAANPIAATPLLNTIRSILNTLGMEGGESSGATSNLVANVDALMQAVYDTKTENGEEVINNESLDYSLRDILGSFYNASAYIYDPQTKQSTLENGRLDLLVSKLSSSIKTVVETNASNTEDIDELNTQMADIASAYINARPAPIGENDYLVLTRTKGKEETVPQSEAELEQAILEGSLYNTYIKLPKGGGGGAVSYQYTAEIIDSPITNTSIKIGDTCNLSFTWRVVDKKESNTSLAGTLQLIINNSIVLTQIVDSNTPYTINLGEYINSVGRKNITLTIMHNAVPETSRYYTITAYNANLLVNLNTEQNFSSELINIPYLATIGSANIGKTLKVFLDDDEEPIATNTTFFETDTSIAIETPSAGAHMLRIYFIADINENLKLPSNIYQVGIICKAGRQEFIATDLANGFEVKQYENLSFNYIVGSSLASIETYNVTISINGEDYYREVPALKQINFTTQINTPGPLHIVITSANASYEVSGTVIANTSYEFKLAAAENLIFNLPVENRSNQENNNQRKQWNNSAESNYLNMLAEQKFTKTYNDLTDEEKATIEKPTITLSNFLFADGYDGWLQDKNGKSFLRLRNTDQVTIHNFPLFKQNNLSDNITFEIVFKTSDVVNANTIFLNQNYNDDTTALQAAIQRELAIRQEMQEQGTTDEDYESETRNYKLFTEFALTELLTVLQEKVIINLTPQRMTIYNSFISRLRYKEEEMTTISYVINGASNNNGDDSQLIYTYINGVLSNIGRYASLIGNYNSIGDLLIGSTECTTDIYAFRVYNTNLTSQQVVNNWIYDISNLTEKTSAYDRNKYPLVTRNSNNKNIITPETLKNCSPGTPYMTIKAQGDLKDSNAMPQSKGGDLATTVDIEYIDRLNEKNSFTASGVKIQVQGTSSQFYPKKNYKIKMSTFVQNNITHKKKPTADDYVNRDTSGQLKENIVKKGYKLSSSSIPVFDFCLKADYASSEGVNNTGLAALYEKLVQANQLWQTEPQKLQTPEEKIGNQIRQGVEGYPIVVFYSDVKNHPNEEPIFLGKYNFNNDKGTHDVFGLKTFQENWYYDTEVDPNENNPLLDENKPYLGDESWEGADNFYPLDVFRPYENGPGSALLGLDKWSQAFPARFPGAWEDATDTDKNGASAVYSLVPDRAALQEVIEWVYSTRTEVLKQATDRSWYDAAADVNDPDYVGPENGLTREEVLAQHLNKFKTEFSNYFNLNLMLLFYCFTEFFLMVDNRAKNVFWTRYITTENRDKNALLAAENQTYGKWLTLPYDFDTSMGINNQGEFQFDYQYEDGEFLPSGQLVFNGQPSILFTNFRKAFDDEIKVAFTNLFRTVAYGFNYESVENAFEAHQSAWSETIFNEDARVKYIAEKANYSMAQGSKREQRQWWLFNRFRYLQSKYQYAADTLFIRANKTGTISVETYADAYISFQLSVGVGATTITKRVLQGETETFTIDDTSANNSVVNIFPASCIKTINGISQLAVDTINLSSCKKLQNIRIGGVLDSANPNLTTANFTLNENNKILRLLDLRNCNGSELTSLDLSMCASLEKVYLAGTLLNAIGLPNGGVLHTIQYPVGITNIDIHNQRYLENLIIGDTLPENEILPEEQGIVSVFNETNDYSHITSITLEGVGPTAEQILQDKAQYEVMKLDIAAIIMQSANNATCNINNITFYMTGAEFKQLFTRLNAINATVNNCTIILKDALPDDLTIEQITQKFRTFKVYDSNGAEYYNIRFYDFSHETIIGTKNVTKGATITNTSIYDAYFTREYTNAYNGITDENAASHPTRQGFGGWQADLTNIQRDLDVYPREVTQYRMDFHYLENKGIPKVYSDYFAVGEEISYFSPPDFVLDYYIYRSTEWTTDSNEPPNYPNDDYRVISTEMIHKQAQVEHLYAVYQHNNAALYNINIYNTDANGNKTGSPLNSTPILKTVVGSNNKILPSELSPYLPSYQGIAFNADEINTPLANRKYQFLQWNPYIPSSGLQVTGDMDILLIY